MPEIEATTGGSNTLGMSSTPEVASSYKSKVAKVEELTIQHLFMDTIFRLYKHVGCAHGCGEINK